MFYIDPNTDTRYYPGVGFSYGDYVYTARAATHEKFVELGFNQISPQTRPDSRFYNVTGPDNAGVYTSTPRDLDALKAAFKLEEKIQARNILSETDWYVTRSVELGEVTAAIPNDISVYRESIRTAVSTRCDAITACTTIEELETLINSGSTDLPAELTDIYNVY